MKSIRTEICIDAPVSKVWECLMDFESYPEWNPLVHIQGKPIVGTKLTNKMYLEGQKEQVFQPTVLEMVPEKRFRWEGHLFVKGLFDGEHYFELQPEGENMTLLVHGENFRGLLVPLIMKMIGDKTIAGFEAMNQALAQRVGE
ncbi:MAG: SRPBCC domain-containing protein [Saprospiraceae bacterium]|nr:SRPBCC domain-containing protein [Saprospiraceae bacterium]